MNRVAVETALLRWARGRAGRSLESLAGRFPQLALWEAGEVRPTLRQLEAFAKAMHVPIGYLFLRAPPEEAMPIPDLRTIGDRKLARPSPGLLETIYLCQLRQAWYQDWARSAGEVPLAFVGSARLDLPVEEAASTMRQALRFDLEMRAECPTWTDALRQFIAQADELGVLVMVSGVVGSNNRRRLDPEEFRGFALADPLAPLVFINGTDTKAAQMFTLAHELAHLWLGESALSDVAPAPAPSRQIEKWCNRVAAELLVPGSALQAELQHDDVLAEVPRLARRFKVSSLVILRRLLDARRLPRDAFDEAYAAELRSFRARPRASGGDFYLTQAARTSRRFARALLSSTFEGQTSFTESLRLLGVKKVGTLRRFGRDLGVLD